MQINNSVKHALFLSCGLDDRLPEHQKNREGENSSSDVITYLDEAGELLLDR